MTKLKNEMRRKKNLKKNLMKMKKKMEIIRGGEKGKKTLKNK